MIDNWNRVLTNLTTAEKGICSHVTSANSDKPPGFPALYVNQTDNSDIAEDLENTENAVQSEVELQSYSNKSLTEARKVISTACDAMRRMGYRRRMGPNQVTNAAATNVFRMVARFERVIGAGEEIEKFEV